MFYFLNLAEVYPKDSYFCVLYCLVLRFRFADLVPDEENGDDFFPTGEFYSGSRAAIHSRGNILLVILILLTK